MKTFDSFSQWFEFVDADNKFGPVERQKNLVTFDFDETLTRWSDGHNGEWMQLPNEENIKNYLREHFNNGDTCVIVTYRNPSLANDPRFKLYTKIEPYLQEWGLEDIISHVVYTRLGPKPPYILLMAEHLQLPFFRHYDDDATHTTAVNKSPELKKIAAKRGMLMGMHLPYYGPRPPAPSITPSGMALVARK